MVLHKHSLDAGALATFAEQLDLVLAAHSTSLVERKRGVYAVGRALRDKKARTKALGQLLLLATS